MQDLPNRTSQVIDPVRAGERVVLTVHGEPAHIVPHVRRSRRVRGELPRRGLAERAADPGLRGDLDVLTGRTLDELSANRPGFSTPRCLLPER